MTGTISAVPIGVGPTVDGPVCEVLPVGSIAEIAGVVARARGERVWLLDARAAPAPDALERLAEHDDVAAASLVVGGDGAIREPFVGRPRQDDEPALLAGAARRRLPLRHLPIVSLLVAREAASAFGAPDVERLGAYAGAAWSAALFARVGGALVPASRVRFCGPPPSSLLHLPAMARTGVWGRGETLRELRRALGAGG